MRDVLPPDFGQRETSMSRRTLLSGAPALLLHRALRAQRLVAGSPAQVRYRIPAGPVARWNFHRLGQSSSEGATITNVPDETGNGYALAINTDSGTSGRQTPKYTNLAINGRGGYWPGTNFSGESLVGSFKVTLPALTENNFSVLWCAQMGGNTGNGSGGLFSIGGCECWARSGNNTSPKNTLWWNFGTSHGGTQFTDPVNLGAKWAGPVAAGIVNGFGGVGTSSRFMLNRMRSTYTGLNWGTATATTAWIGCTPMEMPACYDTIYHEMAVYNRALTDADLDLWNVYCNQMYGSPLTRSSDRYIDRRVVIGTESVDEAEGSTYCRTSANLLAQTLGNWNHVEYANYGRGQMTLANFYAGIGTGILDMYDASLGAGHNIFIFGGGSNDVGAGRTAASVWSDSPHGDSIVECLQTLRSQGWKIVLCTRSNSDTWSAAGRATLGGTSGHDPGTLNDLILTNGLTYADAICDYTPLWSQQQSGSYNNGGHPNDAMCAQMNQILSPAIAELL